MSMIERCLVACTLVSSIVAGCGDDDSSDPSGGAGTGGRSDSGAAGADAGTAGGISSGEGGAAGATAAGAAGEDGAMAGSSAGGVSGAEGGAGGTGDAGAAGAAGAAGEGGSGGEGNPLATFTVLDVNDVKDNPEAYAWFDFRPNVKKLILAGAAETEHVAILWYTVTDGGVGLHYHAKTESVYVIDGTQTDAKGVYGDGTVYFNPPGSGHQITGSSGFFLLAYAAPPDFVNTGLIEEYEPVRIDTTAADLTTTYDFTLLRDGIQKYAVPLDAQGGLDAELLETTSPTAYAYEGNYLLVLDGSCDVEGTTVAEGTLIVAKTVVPQHYRVSAAAEQRCLALGVSF